MVVAHARPDSLLGWMTSLADPTRLRLLRLLDRLELSVADLCDIVQLPQSTVSRHLKLLADRGWLRSRRQGTVRLYRAAVAEQDPAARRLWLLSRETTDAWPVVRQDQARLDRRLRRRRDERQAFFAGAVARWDSLRDRFYGPNFATQATLALLSENAVVADLGCGTASLAVELAPWVGRVIGVDSSSAMLKAAARRVAEWKNIELRRGELTAVPIDDATCDAAMLLLVLSYVADPTPVLNEAARILRPGGRVVAVDLLPHDREDFSRRMEHRTMGFEPERMERIARDAGLTAPRIVNLPPETGVKGPALFLMTARRG